MGLAPELHVGDRSFCAACTPFALPPARVAAMRAEMLRDGFFTLLPSDLHSGNEWAVDFAAMRAGVAKIVAAGWPAPLLLVYDEVWAIAHQLSSVMAAVSGGNRNSLDMLAWSVCAARGEAGFA